MKFLPLPNALPLQRGDFLADWPPRRSCCTPLCGGACPCRRPCNLDHRRGISAAARRTGRHPVSGNPLRAAITSLSQAQQVAILIDRRVDPGQKLELTLKDVPMESALQTIADRCGLGVSRLGPSFTSVRHRPPDDCVRSRLRLSRPFVTADGRATEVLSIEST